MARIKIYHTRIYALIGTYIRKDEQILSRNIIASLWHDRRMKNIIWKQRVFSRTKILLSDESYIVLAYRYLNISDSKLHMQYKTNV